MTILTCRRDIIDTTIAVLQRGGQANCGTVVLWLSRSGEGGKVEVQQVYKPMQEVAEDYFHLPLASMRALIKHLREHRLRVEAQVHTHPKQAFHSAADDQWAIVRHTGALSLVLPHFARGATSSNFLELTKVFQLSPENKWQAVEPSVIEIQ